MPLVFLLAAVAGANITVGGPRIIQLDSPIFLMIASGGFLVIIPNAVQIESIVFHGNIDRAIKAGEGGTIVGSVYSQGEDGRWICTNPSTKLKRGNTIHYWIAARMRGRNYESQPNYVDVRTFAELPNKNIFGRCPSCGH